MNQHQTSFARSLPPRVAAEGRGLVAPPCGAQATIIHDQMYDDRRAGQLVGECSRHAPVRVLYDRGRGAFMRTGRGFGLGIFSAEGRGSNPRLANNHPLSAERLKNFAKGSKRHSSAPSSVSKQHGTEGVGSAQEILGVYQNVVDC